MRDRIPTKPNRRKITFEDDNTVKYAKIEYADEPTEEGTPLNKGNLLSDATALKFGLEGDSATVNNAFKSIGDTIFNIPNNFAQIMVTVKYSDGTPLVGAEVSGFTGLVDNITNDKGQLLVQVSSLDPITISVPTSYIDIEIPPATVTPIYGKRIDVDLIVNALEEVKITTSKSIKISSAVQEIDLFLVGGGGKGESGTSNTGPSGRGGCGGYTTTQLNATFAPNTSYSAIIGAGGTTSDGGASSLMGITANGGQGYSGTGSTSRIKGGSGGSYSTKDGASNGNDGVGVYSGTGQGTTTRAFGEINRELYSGGGGGGSESSGINGKGGEGGGGNGGINTVGQAGTANTGGGGGGGSVASSTTRAGGNGGSGIIIMRFRR